MNVDTPAQRRLAGWLLAEELGGGQGSAALAEAAERACQKLSRRLAVLVTEAGTVALQRRALHLARAEFPFLSGVRAGTPPEACLDGLPDCLQDVELGLARDGLVAVLAGWIGLLITFIGENLTLRLVRDVWPDAPFGPAGAGWWELQT